MTRLVSNGLQLTLAIIKPDAIYVPHVVENICKTILKENFFILRRTYRHLTRCEAEAFYSEHKTRFFYNRLVLFMSSGRLLALILARHNCIAHWRHLMGPTHVYKTRFTHPNSIRGKYGLTDTRNVVHGSDSPVTALREIAFFFPDFDANQWQREEASKFLHGEVIFNEDEFVHKPIL